MTGGPLTCQVDGTWLQAGVVSWGEAVSILTSLGPQPHTHVNWILTPELGALGLGILGLPWPLLLAGLFLLVFLLLLLLASCILVAKCWLHRTWLEVPTLLSPDPDLHDPLPPPPILLPAEQREGKGHILGLSGFCQQFSPCAIMPSSWRETKAEKVQLSAKVRGGGYTDPGAFCSVSFTPARPLAVLEGPQHRRGQKTSVSGITWSWQQSLKVHLRSCAQRVPSVDGRALPLVETGGTASLRTSLGFAEENSKLFVNPMIGAHKILRVPQTLAK
ncbi:Hypothetical predicted protein [Marmota monax]|uniref:Uncharacterized protein n=1 Tax=Marmota monax TaxID=9995 RepID=A0A5E4AWN9_MARMO|nr:hypothetical protein GHT09_016735 [Marmota monax]VTJ61828.1 Hypothetical predicted protein [Marmota monax]